jgi:hypothetical protein
MQAGVRRISSENRLSYCSVNWLAGSSHEVLLMANRIRPVARESGLFVRTVPKGGFGSCTHGRVELIVRNQSRLPPVKDMFRKEFALIKNKLRNHITVSNTWEKTYDGTAPDSNEHALLDSIENATVAFAAS